MVALAGILAPDPEVLVLDEPTSFLDPEGRDRVLAALAGFSVRGGTTLLVTHDMEEAARAHRIVLLLEGKIAFAAEPGSFFSDSAMLETGHLVKPFGICLSQELEQAGHSLPDPHPEIHNMVNSVARLLGKSRGGLGIVGRDEISKLCHKREAGAAMEFEKVAFSYNTGSPDEREVLTGVDLDVMDRGLTVLCGANGSGKSTLLQLANGLLAPDGGRVLYRGQSLADLLKGKVKIPSLVGLLFQNPERQVFAETVFDDIAFGPRNLGLPEKETVERVHEAIGWAGIEEEFLSRSPFTLSGGQLRRVAIAGVLALRSRILVLDEPTDGLDPASSAMFFGKVREYGVQTDTSVLIATHSVPDPPVNIDSMAFLADGRIGACGEPAEVLFSASGAVPETFLPPHIKIQRDITDAGFSLPELSLDPDEVIENIVSLIADRSG